MIFFYDLILLIASFFYFPVLLMKKKWHGDMLMRFGFGLEKHIQSTEQSAIWLHAVSVGEVLSIINLIKELKSRYPHYVFVCSTVTRTGYNLAREKLPKQVNIIFAPLDISWIVKRYLNLIRPAIYIAAETEIWPNLFTLLTRHDVPVMIINGRISDKAFVGYQRYQGLFKRRLEP